MRSDVDTAAHAASFLPNAARAWAVDHAVRGRVAESVKLLGEVIGSELPGHLPAIARMLTDLRRGRVRPALFALYSDLVLALEDESESELIATLTAIESASFAAPGAPTAVTLTDETLGPGMAQRYFRHFDDDPLIPICAMPVTDPELEAAGIRLREALSLIREADPQLDAEVARLVQEIVFARSGAGAPGFGGSTTFYLWGAVLINSAAHPNSVSLAQGIVHEAAHTLLFGLTLGAPLVTNDPTELYESPLRADARPMDGIVHACFVLARLYHLVRALINSSCVDCEADHLRSILRRYRKDFRAGDDVIKRYANFTPTGQVVYEAARQYMLRP